MKYNLLGVVVLKRDLPEYGLCKGDLGSILEIYSDNQYEVEFVRASGKTQACQRRLIPDPLELFSEIHPNMRA
jgi:hypothetical protein